MNSRAMFENLLGVLLFVGLLSSGCAGSSATQRNSATVSVRQTSTATVDADVPATSVVEASDASVDAQVAPLVGVIAGPPIVAAPPALPPATPLANGVSLIGEPTENGGAFVVIRNGGTRPLRIRAFASAEVYSAERWFAVENALISINPQCADHPECITLAPSASIRAPVWPGTSCPSVQCASQSCRHNGAGVYRFVVTSCRGQSLEGAPFVLSARDG